MDSDTTVATDTVVLDRLDLIASEVIDEDVWITADSNSLAIQGPWWVEGSVGSSISVDIFTDGSMCATGTAALVEDEEWEIYWGALFQIPSNDDDESDFEFCISNIRAVVD